MTRKTIACCRECSKPLENVKRTHRAFCGTPCKAAWNNRRKTRGADLYDLFMAMRYRREEAKALNVWTEMCRLAEQWHDEDVATGRQTFEKPAAAVGRLKDRGAIRRGTIYRVR